MIIGDTILYYCANYKTLNNIYFQPENLYIVETIFQIQIHKENTAQKGKTSAIYATHLS